MRRGDGGWFSIPSPCSCLSGCLIAALVPALIRLWWLTMDGHRAVVHCAPSHMVESVAPLLQYGAGNL